jgi:hypothetical protein
VFLLDSHVQSLRNKSWKTAGKKKEENFLPGQLKRQCT